MPRPRTHIDDSYLERRSCPICGSGALRIGRKQGVPDHVACGGCRAVFVLEQDGGRVMFGRIPPGHPGSDLFPPNQWVSIEPPAPAPPPPPPQPAPADLPDWLAIPVDEAEPERPARARPGSELEFPDRPAPAPAASAERTGEEPTMELPHELGRPAGRATPPAAAPAAGRSRVPVGEPQPGLRHRVVVRGERVAFPQDVCAHCFRTPAPARLTVVGTWPTGAGERAGKTMAFNVPLCESCRRRARARGETERTARLQAHLISALIAVLLLVAALVLDLIEPGGDLLANSLIIAILLTIGYSAPAVLLLGRTGSHPPPPDAVFVRSTLWIPLEEQSLEVPFEWRNRLYAERFYQVNSERVVGGVSERPDQSPAASAA